jgi:copper chaperone CopZ
MEGLRVGEVARRTGVSVETVRFYEREGILDAARRRPSGYRAYPEDAVRRVRRSRPGFAMLDSRCPRGNGERTVSPSGRIAMGVLLTLCLLGAGASAGAQILSADLRVNGMSCPFCAFGIEKKLLEVDGVAAVEVLLDEGRLHLRLEPENTATPAALQAAVEKAGFELAGPVLEVRGTLEVGPAEAWLTAHDGLRFLLLEPDGEGERPLAPSSRSRLQDEGRGQVTASGRVLGTGDAPRLVVDLERAAESEGR